MKKRINVLLLILLGLFIFPLQNFSQENEYYQRFLDLRTKIYDPANGYLNREGIPYHSVEELICEAPDYGHTTTSEAYSYWIWLEVMYGKLSGNWTPLNQAFTKMETYAIPLDAQPTVGDYNPNDPADFASEFPLPNNYPSPINSSIPVGQDPVSPDLKEAYGSAIYGMHWLFDCDNFYGYGNKGDGVSTPSYINTFQRGEQESVWETVPHPSWEDFKWGSNDGSGFLKLFIDDPNPSKQWRYTNAPDADARVVQALYWASEFAKEQELTPSSVLPLSKASKMGDFVRLAMFDKYFKPLGVQNVNGPGGTGYNSAHYLISWYYSWGGPLVANGWSFRIGCSHNHFGYQNPVAAYALSATPELRPASANGARDWGTSLTRQLEFYQWLQSAEGAIAGGATNSWNGNYSAYPSGRSTFYQMAYDDHPVYHDPGSNTWFGWQAWSMERVAEYYYITNNARAKSIMDKWVTWAKSVVRLNSDGTFDIPSEMSWSGQPVTWNPSSPAANTNLHVTVVSYGKDLGISASLAKTLIYYAAATERYGTLDTESRDLAKEILDRMWTNYYEPSGKGVAVEENRGDYSRFFEQEVYIPAGWNGKMANGDIVEPGVSFIDIRSKYRQDPDWPALEAAYNSGQDYVKKYHRFWAQAEIALANAEYGRFFVETSPDVPVTGVSVTPTSASVAVNGTQQLTATVAPANATNKTVTWTSSGTAIATVSSSGLVTGRAAGSAVITARTQDGGFTATSTITVTTVTIPVTGVSVTPTSASVEVNGTQQLTATVAPANATNKTVTWASSSTAIATVSSSGLVTGRAAGSAVITARTQDGGFTATSTITVTTVTIPVTGVSVTPTSASVEVNGTQQLTATVAPANATNKTVTWASSSTAIATVSSSGLVTGRATGSATITVTTADGGFTATSTITVSDGEITPCDNPVSVSLPKVQNGTGEFCWVTSGNITYVNSWNMTTVEINGVDFTNKWSNSMPARIDGNYYIYYRSTVGWAHLEVNGTDGGNVPVTGVSVTPTTASVNVNGTQQLTATVAPANATNKTVTWTSSSTAIATVSSSGLVTGRAAGSAVVTARTQDGGFTATSTITVTTANVPVTGVSVTPTTASVNVNGTQQLTATVAPANATNKTVTWTSGSTAIATVSSSGLVTGRATGSAVVTVRTQDGGFTATSTITVTTANVPVTGVSVTPTTATLAVNGTQQLTATVAPANATNKTVTWTSNSTAIATVSSSGLVTGRAAGSAVITVRTQDGGFTATCAVTVEDGGPQGCDNPVAISIPFVQNGAGEYCWVTTTAMAYINSWALTELTINGVDFTNIWSNNLPPAQNGQWEIHYVGNYGWSHFEAPAAKDAETISSVEDYIRVYPNPFDNELYIDLNGIEGVRSIELINPLGQVIEVLDATQIAEGLNIMTIDESGSMFILRIQTDDQIILKSIVKN